MIGYEVTIDGLEEQLRKLNAYDAIANKHLATAMRSAVNTIVSEVKPLAPVGVSGQLRNSIGSQVFTEALGSVVGKVGSSLKDEVYPSVMEFGRRPGTAPPPGALDRWVHLKLRVPENPAEVAYRIGQKIKMSGIKGKFFMKKGFEKAKDKILGYFNAALVKITRELSIGD